MQRWLLGSCAAIAAFAASPSNATHFTFTLTGLSGAVAGSFDGTLNGNLITNLSNISAFMNGVALQGNGTLFASRYDYDCGCWFTGGGVASLDGTQNNFLFIDSNYPVDTGYTNLLYSVIGIDTSYWANYNTNTFSMSYDWTFKATSSEDSAQAAVPESAGWALMLLGFGLVGSSLRSNQRRRVTFNN